MSFLTLARIYTTWIAVLYPLSYIPEDWRRSGIPELVAVQGRAAGVVIIYVASAAMLVCAWALLPRARSARVALVALYAAMAVGILITVWQTPSWVGGLVSKVAVVAEGLTLASPPVLAMLFLLQPDVVRSLQPRNAV